MIRIARRTRLYGTLSRGHSTRKPTYDPQSQAAQAAQSDIDTPHAPSDASGNPERIGFAEQVGSASASAQDDSSTAEKGPAEEAAAPGLFSAVKQAMGFETSTDDVKQNKGRGEGVTGSGTNPTSSRRYHTSAVLQSTPPSQKPKEKTLGDQNEHLVHKKNPREKDGGKGNAGDDPVLPSHQQSDSDKAPAGHRKGGSGYGSDDPERFTK